MTHVDDAVLAHLRDGSGALTPAALLEADDHLAGCESCRARLQTVIAAESAHLGAEDIAALAAGAGSLAAQSHLSTCPECAEAVQSLTAFAKEVEAYRSGPRRMIGRVAAGLAAAIVVTAGAWWLGRGTRPINGAALMASADAAQVLHDRGRSFALGADAQLLGAEGLTPRDSAWIVDALRGVPLRGLSASGAAAAAEQVRRDAPGDHLLIGALEEQAGDTKTAVQQYRALVAENPGSAVAEDLLAGVERRP